ncbi:Pol poly [Labeo rohita]|uniref:Pol poly n=1 Tax=Labeo rohita TaxID=84645 RepID=A0A498NTN0_LABRO|nr:Pol poly [Labeo rohita]
MDAAKETPIRSAVELQGAMLGQHEEELAAARYAVESLSAQVMELTNQLQNRQPELPVMPQTRNHPEPRINNPPCFSGQPTECRAFLSQCEMFFFPPTIYLCGGLLQEEMLKVFDCSVYGHEASRQLATLSQGRRSAADFAIEFRTLAATCEWNKPALTACFLEGLTGEIKEEILARDLLSSLDQLVELAIRLDKRFELHRHARAPGPEPRPQSFSDIFSPIVTTYFTPAGKGCHLGNSLYLWGSSQGIVLISNIHSGHTEGTANIYESADATINNDTVTDSESVPTEHIYAEIEHKSTSLLGKTCESSDTVYSKLTLVTHQGGWSPSRVSQWKNSSQTSQQNQSEEIFKTLQSDSVNVPSELAYAEFELKSTKKQKKNKGYKGKTTESSDIMYTGL